MATGALVLVVLRLYFLRELKHAVLNLSNEKKRVELILNSVGDGVITIDSEGIVFSANLAVEKIFGYATDEIIGRNIEILIPPYRVDEHDRKQVIGSERLVTAHRRDGGKFPVEIRIAKICVNGNLQFVCSMRDITESKQAQDEVQRLNSSLEERVEKRTGELQRVNEEMRAFSYSLSHDLRTPLSSIAGFSALLRKRLDSAEGDELNEHYLSRISTGVVQMSELIDALLKLTHLSQITLRSDRVDLSAMAQSILNTYQERDPGRVAKLDIEAGLVAQGDPRLLHQVLDNLLGNAWKFTSHNTHTRIAFRSEITPENLAVYVVQDNGAGFDMAYADKLFGAFQRLHVLSEFAGSGIGLATVHRIITRHGGRVWADSSPGNGATFRFTLGTG